MKKIIVLVSVVICAAAVWLYVSRKGADAERSAPPEHKAKIENRLVPEKRKIREKRRSARVRVKSPESRGLRVITSFKSYREAMESGRCRARGVICRIDENPLKDFLDLKRKYKNNPEMFRQKGAEYITFLLNNVDITTDKRVTQEVRDVIETLTMKKKTEDMLFFMGEYHQRIGDLESARDTYEEMTKLYPDLPPLMNMCNVYYDLSDSKKALECYRKKRETLGRGSGRASDYDDRAPDFIDRRIDELEDRIR